MAQFKRGDFSTCDAPRPQKKKSAAEDRTIYFAQST
jgi:hypothetical protein